jgi:hypothetical protein
MDKWTGCRRRLVVGFDDRRENALQFRERVVMAVG